MIKVVLVDDEEHALEMLGILLNEIGEVVVIGKYTNPLEALDAMKYLQADGVFLDIEMPGMKGMDLARALQVIHPKIQIIFTTAYAEHAIEAFEIRSMDYLLKPIRVERLRQSVQRIREASSIPKAVTDGPSVQCMGGFAVHLGAPEQGMLSWRTTKEKELCAFLIHRGGQVVEQTVIMEALWPESDVDKARAYLYTCISLLRKNLRSHHLPINVNKIGNGYALQLGSLPWDVLEIEAQLDQTLRGEGLSAERLERLAALYSGDYLMDSDYRWSLMKREQLSGRYTEALRRLCAYFYKHNQTAYAIQCLHHVLAVSPDSEKEGRELIKLYLESGNRSEAIKIFKQLERAVKERLDIELEEETSRLYDEMISSSGGRSIS
ncbi:response regulator [Paenibacillus sp. UNC451MF]|uniref:response regulator n=1 Tax=Paenibacillus sp. UNC451MF TaxID=1449063 RepID=UPI00068C7C99|nr:response regulator [Paenibacillus sp. UNC451MF]